MTRCIDENGSFALCPHCSRDGLGDAAHMLRRRDRIAGAADYQSGHGKRAHVLEDVGAAQQPHRVQVARQLERSHRLLDGKAQFRPSCGIGEEARCAGARIFGGAEALEIGQSPRHALRQRRTARRAIARGRRDEHKSLRARSARRRKARRNQGAQRMTDHHDSGKAEPVEKALQDNGVVFCRRPVLVERGALAVARQVPGEGRAVIERLHEREPRGRVAADPVQQDERRSVARAIAPQIRDAVDGRAALAIGRHAQRFTLASGCSGG